MKRLMQKPDRNLVAPSRAIVKLERRLFLKQGLSLGALGLLSGCDVTDADAVQKVLWQMSRWNDGVQAAIFNPNKLAQEYPESAHHQAVSVQRVLFGSRSAARRSGDLQAGIERADSRQGAVDAG